MDYENRFHELEDSDNPFATVVMVFTFPKDFQIKKHPKISYNNPLFSSLLCAAPVASSRGTRPTHWLLCASVVACGKPLRVYVFLDNYISWKCPNQKLRMSNKKGRYKTHP
ncbi:MAG: hypothetical protein V7K92_29300 [Nostoc sp.]|uniref:hypothetical protein n=1 Tax=Nostoc sp. TaxID=1180 RepID=UPI002FF42BE8